MSTTPLPIYNLICIPLDGRDPAKSDKRFEIRVITELQFPPSTTIHSGAIRDVAFQHPLFCESPGKSIKAYIWDFSLWIQNGRTLDKTRAHSVQLKSTAVSRAVKYMNHLSSYLSGDKSTMAAASFEHDARFDSLTTGDFVDTAKGADQFKQASVSLRSATARALASKAIVSVVQPFDGQANASPDSGDDIYNIDAASLGLARWLDAAVHSSLVEALHSNVDREHPNAYRHLGMDAVALTGVQDVIAKISRRMTVTGESSVAGLSNDNLKAVSGTGIDREVSKMDLNVAVHAALKSDLLARSCGLSSTWIVETDFPVGGDRDWIIQIDEDSLPVDTKLVTIQKPVPTVFRRRGHTHPLAYSDIKATQATNCAFAALNAADGTLRYRASSVHPEKALIKQVIIQGQNSLLGPSSSDDTLNGGIYTGAIDTRAPELLRNQQYGSPEPETTGVVFSAPAEDLVTPKDLSNAQTRATSFPCFFLEDLWIGYRLDLRKDNSTIFTSIHKQNLRITLRGSNEVIQDDTENYIDREQLDDPRVGSSSTDLITYSGLSSGQIIDYLTLLGLPPAASSSDDRCVTEMTGYEPAERLLFGHDYEYQLRNVFRGGSSLDVSSLENADAAFIKSHRQTFPFYRARALRPGELLFPSRSSDGVKQSGNTIYLSDANPEQIIYLVPSPIDIDTSRYHGLLLEDKYEPSKYQRRMYVSDLTKIFDNKPPKALNYFYDPDVYGASIYVVSLNGKEVDEPEEIIFANGVYCRLVKHAILATTTKRFGSKGAWQDFTSITLSFRKTSGANLKIDSNPNDQIVAVSVPPGLQLKVILLPLFDPSLAKKNASYAASTAQQAQMESLLNPEVLVNIPAIADQTIEVIHALDKPRSAPIITCNNIPQGPLGDEAVTITIGRREPNGMFGTLVGRVDVDAATTKELSFSAAWSDIDDRSHPGPFTLTPVISCSSSRSISFQPYSPVPAKSKALSSVVGEDGQQASGYSASGFHVGGSSYTFADQFALQCVESKIFLGQDDDDSHSEQNSNPLGKAVKSSLRIDLRDSRRKLAKIRSLGVSRYVDRPEKPTDVAGAAVSDEVLVDFPSSAVMTAPVISHIVPLRRSDEQLGNNTGQIQAVYGFRIYIEKPFFESGPGERIAIGCLAGEEVASSAGSESLHYVTKWGEDPVERASLAVTRRMPKASDFSSPHSDQTGLGRLDAVLYPRGVVGGQRSVIYRDNLKLPASGVGAPRWVSISSFAVSFDVDHALWYADVLVEKSFFGVCGLALYRHQPHSVPGHELSQVCSWAYASIIYGEPIAWIEKDENLRVTIGPVYDPQIAFELQSIAFEDNVSRPLANTIIKPVKTYSVGRERYFEVVVPKADFDWSIVKKRYGIPFTSLRLNRMRSSAGGGTVL